MAGRWTRWRGARQTSFAFDAAVVAGVPFLGSLARRPLVSATERIAGVINGTSHFILTAMAGGATFDGGARRGGRARLRRARQPRRHGGRDAAEKLDDSAAPRRLPRRRGRRSAVRRARRADAADLASAREVGGAIKPVALASLTASRPGAWVGPVFVAPRHPFAHLSASTTRWRSPRENGHTVTFAGPGAGPDVTAVTIIDDIVEAVTAHAPAPEFVRPSPRGSRRAARCASRRRARGGCAWTPADADVLARARRSSGIAAVATSRSGAPSKSHRAAWPLGSARAPVARARPALEVQPRTANV